MADYNQQGRQGQGHYDAGYGQQNNDAYYQDEQNQGYYDQNQAYYQQHGQEGADGYYDEQ